MIVVVANYLPPAVRGRMKLWFVEPKANVFVSGIKDSVADDVIEYLYSHCPCDTGLLIFQKIRQAPGFKVRGAGDTKRSITYIDGLPLIVEDETIRR